MNINRRRGATAFFITLGVLLVGLAVTINIGWIVLNGRTVALVILGVILSLLLIAGVVLNTVFLVREIRRNERQDSFLNSVTHELKTPIASIRLYLETMQRRDVPEAQRQQFYRIMLADSDRLIATVEQVLKAGEQGHRLRHKDRISIELGTLVAECVAITRERHHLPASSVALEPVPGAVRLHVQGVAEDLRTAVLNLLENAVKYASSPETVHVRCRLAIVRYTWVELTVADRGIGIPPNQLKRIFARFYRVPSRAMAKIKGTGLGLFIVRSIARQHGGEALAYSAGIGHGTVMTLRLPLNNPSQAPAELSSSEETDLHRA